MKIISGDPSCILNIFGTFVFRHKIRMQDELENERVGKVVYVTFLGVSKLERNLTFVFHRMKKISRQIRQFKE